MANNKNAPKPRKVKRGDKWYKLETVKTEVLVPTTAPVRSAKQIAAAKKLVAANAERRKNPNTKKK